MAGSGIGGVVAGAHLVFGVVVFPGTMRAVVAMANEHETECCHRTLSGTETVKTGLG